MRAKTGHTNRMACQAQDRSSMPELKWPGSSWSPGYLGAPQAPTIKVRTPPHCCISLHVGEAEDNHWGDQYVISLDNVCLPSHPDIS